jgi:hypothetical protein
MLTFDHEIISMFCNKCKCCLAQGRHCGTCHATKEIDKLCGCGSCVERALDFIEREKVRIRIRDERRAQRNAD